MNELFDYLEDRVRADLAVPDADEIGVQSGRRLGIARSTRVPSVRSPAGGAPELLGARSPRSFRALIDLRDVIEGPDRRIADAGQQALQRLTRTTADVSPPQPSGSSPRRRAGGGEIAAGGVSADHARSSHRRPGPKRRQKGGNPTSNNQCPIDTSPLVHFLRLRPIGSGLEPRAAARPATFVHWSLGRTAARRTAMVRSQASWPQSVWYAVPSRTATQ